MLLFHIFKKTSSFLLCVFGYTGVEVKNTMKKRKHIRKRSVLKIFLFSVMAILLVLLFTAVSVGAYVYYHIDYTVDEELFRMAQGSKTTTVYYNAAGETVLQNMLKNTDPLVPSHAYQHLPSGYVPKELVDQRICGAENGIWCAYEDIPQDLKDALVAIEDRHFFSHGGVDWLRTAKAAANYLLHFDSRFGGSTITQQLIKNISSDNEITVFRKMREMCRAIHLEKHHSKEEILELYLNVIPLSQGCIGVGAAAEVYYGKAVTELSLGECATVAAITNSPAKYDPVTHAENNRARRDLILQEMYALGMISEDEYEHAIHEDINVQGKRAGSVAIYNWYTETVMDDVVNDLIEEYGFSRETAEKMLYSGGLEIYTQMDLQVQTTLEKYFENTRNFPKACRDGARFSMVVVDPTTGDLLGVVGGVGKKTENRILNYATQAIRPPGSAIKPLSVYAPALEEGVINWGSVFDDVPTTFWETAGGYTVWPHNSPMIYSGLTDIRDAVAYSKNTVAVRVLEELGNEKSFLYLSHRLGLDTLVRSRTVEGKGRVTDMTVAPLALGQLTDGVSVRSLTNAYGALANEGVYHTSRSYSVVLDGRGKLLLENKQAGNRVFSKETASIMTKLLQGVTEFGTAKDIKLTHMVDTAGKTGTSGNAYDKWFVGYTPYVVAGIWCGYENGTTAVPSGMANAHLSAWDGVMQILHRRYIQDEEPESFHMTSRVVCRAYCKDSGLLPTDACRADARGDRTAVGYFTVGNEPKGTCNCHVMVDYDMEGGGIARDVCPADAIKRIGMLQILPRQFPVDLYIEDAQYVYDLRTLDNVNSQQEELDTTEKEDDRFNRLCPLHDEGYEDEINEENEDMFRWFRKYFVRNKR